MCSVHIPAYGVQFLVSNMPKNILKYVSFKLAAFQRMTRVLTFLAGIQFCHDIAINPTSQNFLWIGGSRPPDPRLPQASSTGPPPAIAQFKRGAKTVGQCAGVVI